MALNSVDFPTLGSPTIPALSMMGWCSVFGAPQTASRSRPMYGPVFQCNADADQCIVPAASGGAQSQETTEAPSHGDQGHRRGSHDRPAKPVGAGLEGSLKTQTVA